MTGCLNVVRCVITLFAAYSLFCLEYCTPNTSKSGIVRIAEVVRLLKYPASRHLVHYVAFGY